MNPTRLDAITRLFADRKLSRRQTLAVGAGLAAGARAAHVLPALAQDASPEAHPVAPDAEHGPAMLFVQSFQSGSIMPNGAAKGRYTISLDHGLGETLYFSDRPDRTVGSTPTASFLDGLGFSETNPPNAAILTQNPDGSSTLAVVELFAPVYDQATNALTYDLAVLDHWQDAAALGFAETPVDIDTLGESIGITHLFIDDCGSYDIYCVQSENQTTAGTIPNADHDGFCYSWKVNDCLPCQPWYEDDLDAFAYWETQCNVRFPTCDDKCVAQNVA